MRLSGLVATIVLLLIAITLMSAALADPQQATGAIQGEVADAKTGDKLPGITVAVSSPVLPEEQIAITDENGRYTILELPPGPYVLTFYEGGNKIEHPSVDVEIGKLTWVVQKITHDQPGGVVLDHLPRIPPTRCPYHWEARGWVRARVISIEQATYACKAFEDVTVRRDPLDAPTATTGCIKGYPDPTCGNKSKNVSLAVDSVPHAVIYQPGVDGWTLCGLAPGHHLLKVCSQRGDFRCDVDVVPAALTYAESYPVEPRVHVRVEHVFVGAPSWVGRDFVFTLGNHEDATDLTLPPEVELAWTERDNLVAVGYPARSHVGYPPHAYLCDAPRSTSPGCARCDASTSTGGGWWLIAGVAIALGRRRR